MDTAPIPSKAWPFVEQLVPVAGRLHVLLSHMEQFHDDGHMPPDAPPIPEVLAGLLDAVLAPLARRRPDDLAVAADVLGEVSRAIEREISAVAPPDRAARRRGPRPRRPR